MSITLARKLAICWSLAMAAPLVVPAQSLTPQGEETATVGNLAGDQTAPCISSGPGGGHLVWQDNSVTVRGTRIRAVRLDSNLSVVGSPFTVSSAWKEKSTGDQEKPRVASLQDGGGAVVWQGGKVGFQKIFLRFIKEDGTPKGSDIRVSSHPKNAQSDASIATLSDGSVIVVWSSWNQDGSMSGVFARHYSDTGSAIGPEFPVNVTTPFNQRSPNVAALSNGGFVVVWVSELQRGESSTDVYGRVFDSADVGGGEFPINIETNRICANPNVIGSASGGFIVGWSENAEHAIARPSSRWDPTGKLSDATQDPAAVLMPSTPFSGNGWDVVARVFDSSNAPIADPFRVNTYTYGDQYAPTFGVVGDHCLVLWTSMAQDGSRQGVYGQLLSAAGQPEGSEFQVNTTWGNRQDQPTVVSDGQSAFLAVWAGFVGGTSVDLFSQSYLLTP